ncbi:hypothetical protein FQN55_009157 [Onygenales sp. PD_40]|nr:hypothetical protein FQN55_009157 [Onygenales sp. PD_40]KAK2788695.1 hypothetical protein FQN53_003204 [Emmonsiellopsis sp. PD_33]
MSTDEKPPDPQETTPRPYTIFTLNERRYLTYLLGFLTLASSLTATIYFPLIDLLSAQYAVSIQAINLSITLYVIFQAISPAFWAPISDTFGRRPVFLVTFFVYTVASLGLALNRSSYVALLLLRGLQSIGGSAVMSLAYGVVADVSSHAERGRILGPMLASTNLGPCVGPVIGGGAILASGDAQWCFWALLIFGVLSLLLIGWTLPETARSVVGNGSVPPQTIWKTWWGVLLSSNKARVTERVSPDVQLSNGPSSSQDDGNNGTDKTGKGTWTLPNPFVSLRIIFYWDTFLILWLAASAYAVWYCIQTSIPLIYGRDYALNDLIVGLCFVPGGAGVIFGGLISGRLLDWNYKRAMEEEARLPIGNNIDQIGEGRADSPHQSFPFEKARSRGSMTILCLCTAALIGYGWAIEYHAHMSIPLILQFIIGAKCTIVLQMFSALLVDIFPEKPGAAAAANNITRCALSAAAVAVLQPLSEAIRRSWFFSLIGLVHGGGGLLAVWLLRRWGCKWRRNRGILSSYSS